MVHFKTHLINLLQGWQGVIGGIDHHVAMLSKVSGNEGPLKGASVASDEYVKGVHDGFGADVGRVTQNRLWNESTVAPMTIREELALERKVLPYQNLSEYYRYIRQTAELSDELCDLLKWSEGYPEIFERLFRWDVVPLDPTFEQGKIVPVAAYLKRIIDDFVAGRSRLFVDMADTLEETIECHVKEQIHSRCCVRGVRGDRYFEKVLKRRDPLLLPYFRFSPAIARIIKKQEEEIYQRGSQSKGLTIKTPRMIRPGLFTNFRLGDLYDSGMAEMVFWRQMWVSHSDPKTAIEGLINRGDLSKMAKEMRQIDLIKHLRSLSPLQINKMLMDAGDSTSYPDKFFVSVSSKAEDLAISEAIGNLQIMVVSERAFELPPSISNRFEAEFGIPIAINPREIRRAVLNPHDDKNRVTIDLVWSPDYTEVKAIVKQPAQKPFKLTYQYDVRSREYVEV